MDTNLEWSNSNHDLMYQALSFPIYPECVEAFCTYTYCVRYSIYNKHILHQIDSKFGHQNLSIILKGLSNKKDSLLEFLKVINSNKIITR